MANFDPLRIYIPLLITKWLVTGDYVCNPCRYAKFVASHSMGRLLGVCMKRNCRQAPCLNKWSNNFHSRPCHRDGAFQTISVFRSLYLMPIFTVISYILLSLSDIMTLPISFAVVSVVLENRKLRITVIFYQISKKPQLWSQAAQSRQPCVNGHQLSQWEPVIFDPLQKRRPLTDR